MEGLIKAWFREHHVIEIMSKIKVKMDSKTYGCRDIRLHAHKYKISRFENTNEDRKFSKP